MDTFNLVLGITFFLFAVILVALGMSGGKLPAIVGGIIAFVISMFSPLTSSAIWGGILVGMDSISLTVLPVMIFLVALAVLSLLAAFLMRPTV